MAISLPFQYSPRNGEEDTTIRLPKISTSVDYDLASSMNEFSITSYIDVRPLGFLDGFGSVVKMGVQ
jgi:hypothetical protein